MDVLNPKKDFQKGEIILINKPLRWTSFDVVKKIRSSIIKNYNIKKIKVGHAGTLDPLATGLLIICTGKLTKKLSEIQQKEKTYTGEICLGATTPSYDLETKINSTFKTEHISKELLFTTTKKFIGNIEQTPPIYSALKNKGERLYKKARRGEKIIIPKRQVLISSFEITKIQLPKFCFKITCSKGTYIRSLAYDFGKELKSGGYLSKLSRDNIGEYSLKQAINIHDFDRF